MTLERCRVALAMFVLAATAVPSAASAQGRYGPLLRVPAPSHVDGPPNLFGAAVVVLVVVGGLLAAVFGRGRPRGTPGPQSPLWNGVDMVRLRLALDWRAADALRPAVAQLARHANGARKERARALHRALDVLAEHRVSWLLAEVEDHRPMSPPIASATLATMRAELRAGDQALASGAREGLAAEGYRALGVQGEGVVLMTLVVASRSIILDVGASDLRAVDRVLSTLRKHTAAELVALEVALTPSTERARLAVDSLLVRHPRMERLEGIRGRAFCARCGAPYESGLERCPHCGEARAR